MKKTINILLLVSLAFMFFFSFFYFNFLNFRNYIPKPNIEKNNTENISEIENQKEKNYFKIIAVGDSLTAGYNLALEESYPKILEKKLLAKGKKVEIINAGISGETTAGLLERVEFIKSQEPKMILITTGGNDAFRNLPIENTYQNIEKIIISLKEKVSSKNIFLMQIQAPINLGLVYAKDFNNMYQEIAKRQKVNLIPFVTKEVFLNRDLMLEDGIHPNKDGYEFIVDSYILNTILKEIK